MKDKFNIKQNKLIYVFAYVRNENLENKKFTTVTPGFT